MGLFQFDKKYLQGLDPYALQALTRLQELNPDIPILPNGPRSFYATTGHAGRSEHYEGKGFDLGRGMTPEQRYRILKTAPEAGFTRGAYYGGDMTGTGSIHLGVRGYNPKGDNKFQLYHGVGSTKWVPMPKNFMLSWKNADGSLVSQNIGSLSGTPLGAAPTQSPRNAEPAPELGPMGEAFAQMNASQSIGPPLQQGNDNESLAALVKRGRAMAGAPQPQQAPPGPGPNGWADPNMNLMASAMELSRTGIPSGPLEVPPQGMPGMAMNAGPGVQAAIAGKAPPPARPLPPRSAWDNPWADIQATQGGQPFGGLLGNMPRMPSFGGLFGGGAPASSWGSALSMFDLPI